MQFFGIGNLLSLSCRFPVVVAHVIAVSGAGSGHENSYPDPSKSGSHLCQVSDHPWMGMCTHDYPVGNTGVKKFSAPAMMTILTKPPTLTLTAGH